MKSRIEISEEYYQELEGPFDSIIEIEFAREICKYLKEGVIIETQQELSTRLGNFRPDFSLLFEEKKLIIELDGKEHHKGSRDLWRDAFILGEKKSDYIIRFTGKDIVHNLGECLYILIKLHPEYFSNRSLKNIPNLLDRENKLEIDKRIIENQFGFLDLICFEFMYTNDTLESQREYFETKYKKQSNGYWKKYFDYAHKNGIFKMEQLIEQKIL
jgi:very-short-patch-repair endonuclease